MPITLPEITIVGHADASPVTPTDWFCEGFMFGWNHAGENPGAPAPLNDATMAVYCQGVTAGQKSRSDTESQYTGPTLGSDPGGELYDDVERRWKDAWAEFLKHDDPHSETDPPEIELAD
jgi:hypothetical protein